jgi:hypothetical protein
VSCLFQIKACFASSKLKTESLANPLQFKVTKNRYSQTENNTCCTDK